MVWSSFKGSCGVQSESPARLKLERLVTKSPIARDRAAADPEHKRCPQLRCNRDEIIILNTITCDPQTTVLSSENHVSHNLFYTSHTEMFHPGDMLISARFPSRSGLDPLDNIAEDGYHVIEGVYFLDMACCKAKSGKGWEQIVSQQVAHLYQHPRITARQLHNDVNGA